MTPHLFENKVDVLDLATDRLIVYRQLLRSQFDSSVASFRTSAEDGDATASDTALPLPGVGGR